jgi:AbrB family looped-hinge helix DNA binding protein
MVLLELYLAAMEGRTLFQSCLSTTESPSAPHRRSAYLARMGFLQREHDPGDNRRVNLALCPSTMRLLDKAMDRIVTLHEHTAGEMAGLSSPQPREGQVKYPKAQVCAEGLDGMKCPQGKIIAGGRLVLPVDIRRSLNLRTGDTVVFELETGSIRIRPVHRALRDIQERLRACAPTEGLASEELIAQRRAGSFRG